MRTRIAIILFALVGLALLGTRADARPVSAGISAGVLHDKTDADEEGDRTLGLYGRVGLTKRLSGQLEVMKIDQHADASYDAVTVRAATLLLVVDLVDKGRLVPTLKVGAGIDRATSEWQTEKGHHYEGGFGLEYRADDGLTIGIDLRMGGRSVDEPEYEILPADARVAPYLYDGYGLREGEYRAARITLGIVF